MIDYDGGLEYVHTEQTWEQIRAKVFCMVYSNYSLYFQYLTLYAQKLGCLSGRFEKLVKLSGTHLTQYCYAMITYIQVNTGFMINIPLGNTEELQWLKH